MNDLSFASSRLRVNELLEQHFDTAFAAPNGIKKLRELILTLAMQGKLVAQDANDPPASQLLQEIAAEKLRLVKEGKIKDGGTRRREDAKEIKAEEMLYELPKGWEWVRLNDVLDVRDGTHDTPKYVDIGYPLITSKNIYTGKLSFDDVKFISAIDHQKICERSKVDAGDILFAMIGSIGNPVIVECDTEFSIKNVALFKFHLKGKPDNRYLHYFLTRAQENMKAISSGAVQSFVSLGFLRAYSLPLPPIAEQHRIVAKIDQLMARCDALERLRDEREHKRRSVHAAVLKQLLEESSSPSFAPSRLRVSQFFFDHFSELYTVRENVTELRKAILQLAVMGKLVPQDPNDPPASQLLKEIEAEKKRLVKEGKIRGTRSREDAKEIKPEEVPYALPQGWEWVRIENIAETIDYGTSQKTGDDSSLVPVYRMGNIVDGRLIEDGFKYLPPDIDDLPKLYLKCNDILFNRTNSYELVGKSALYTGQNECATFASYLIRVRIFEKRLLPIFFSLAMNAPYFRATQIEPEIVQQCGQANFNGTKLSLCLVPLPPLPEQHRIVAKIDQLMALCDALEQQIDAASGKQAALLDAVMAQV